ncbi:hypothetical protein IFR05_004160 [Cadophora sp. M221]|nr:hypothetical protein IFR05_004160 [Cadophora sp. M221]
MFLDTAFNSLQTVKTNMSTAFTETAVKMWMYARCLGGKRPGWRLVVETIENLINLAFILTKSKAKNTKNVGYKCALTKVQVEWYVKRLSLLLANQFNIFSNVMQD